TLSSSPAVASLPSSASCAIAAGATSEKLASSATPTTRSGFQRLRKQAIGDPSNEPEARRYVFQSLCRPRKLISLAVSNFAHTLAAAGAQPAALSTYYAGNAASDRGIVTACFRPALARLLFRRPFTIPPKQRQLLRRLFLLRRTQ